MKNAASGCTKERRIAKRIRAHIEECRQGKDARDPLARFLRTYSIFILDHTSKEDRFFDNVTENKSLSGAEESDLEKKFEQMKKEWLDKNADLFDALEQLERSEWARQST